MLPDDLRADREREEAATERLNAGEQVPEVDAAWIERIWEVMQRIPRDKRQHMAIGLGAIAGPDRPQIGPEERLALMVRYMLLDAVIEYGVLNEYMDDEVQRKKVFAAAASIRCDKDDVAEAVAQRQIRESPAAVAEKVKEEFRTAGCAPDHFGIGDRYIEWMRDRR